MSPEDGGPADSFFLNNFSKDLYLKLEETVCFECHLLLFLILVSSPLLRFFVSAFITNNVCVPFHSHQRGFIESNKRDTNLLNMVLPIRADNSA